MQDCQWIERLDAYHDGELPAEQAEAVAEHLRQCPSCAAAHRELAELSRMVRAALRESAAIAAPSRLVQRMHRQIDRQEEAVLARIGGWFAAAAAAVLLLCAAPLWQFATAAEPALPMELAMYSSTPPQLLTQVEEEAEPSVEQQLAEWIAADLAAPSQEIGDE